MSGYTTKQLTQLLISNGWKLERQKSSHLTYHKEGTDKIITIVESRKELCRPLCRRLLKDAGIL